MNVIDYIIIALLVVVVAIVIVFLSKRRGGCCGCDNCNNKACKAKKFDEKQ